MSIPDGMALVPVTGELVDLSDTQKVAAAWRTVKEAQDALRAARAELDAALIAESRRRGTKTFRLQDGLKVEVTGGAEIQWDMEVLDELREVGLPEERFGELVAETVEYKVSSAVARQLEGASDVYAEIIGRARSRFPKPQRATVKEV